MPKYKDMHKVWSPTECVCNPRGNVFPSNTLYEAWTMTYFLLTVIDAEVRIKEWNAKHEK